MRRVRLVVALAVLARSRGTGPRRRVRGRARSPRAPLVASERGDARTRRARWLLPATWTVAARSPRSARTPSSSRSGSRAGAAYGIPWQVLAAINKIESNFGRNMGPSSAGAVGWMQFMPVTWLRWGTDGDGDGIADPWNPEDGDLLRRALPRSGGRRDGPLPRRLRLQPRGLVRRRRARAGRALRPGRRPATLVYARPAPGYATRRRPRRASSRRAKLDRSARGASARRGRAPRPAVRRRRARQTLLSDQLAARAASRPSRVIVARRGAEDRVERAPRRARRGASARSTDARRRSQAAVVRARRRDAARPRRRTRRATSSRSAAAPSVVSVARDHHDYPAADIAAPAGRAALRARRRVVVHAGAEPTARCGIGATMRTADGPTWTYCHLSYLDPPSSRAPRSPRAPVGLVGSTGHSTGPHLHLQLAADGRVPAGSGLVPVVRRHRVHLAGRGAARRATPAPGARSSPRSPATTGRRDLFTASGLKTRRGSCRWRRDGRHRLAVAPAAPRSRSPLFCAARDRDDDVRRGPAADATDGAAVQTAAAAGPRVARRPRRPPPGLRVREGHLEDAGFAWRVVGHVHGYAANIVATQYPLRVRASSTRARRLSCSRSRRTGSYGRKARPRTRPRTSVRERELAGRRDAGTPPSPRRQAEGRRSRKPRKRTVAQAAARPRSRSPVRRRSRWTRSRCPSARGASSRFVAKHPQADAAARRTTGCYQHAWIVTGAKFGWWRGAAGARDPDRRRPPSAARLGHRHEERRPSPRARSREVEGKSK